MITAWWRATWRRQCVRIIISSAAFISVVVPNASAICELQSLAAVTCPMNSEGKYVCPFGSTISLKAKYVGGTCLVKSMTWSIQPPSPALQETYAFEIKPVFPYTFSLAGAYQVSVNINTGEAVGSIDVVAVHTYTLSIKPNTGGTVFAKESVLDAVAETHGIECSGNSASSDALECQERYAQGAKIVLKVVPEPGRVFLGWRVNGKLMSDEEFSELLNQETTP